MVDGDQRLDGVLSPMQHERHSPGPDCISRISTKREEI
jgi:hypothetical protein